MTQRGYQQGFSTINAAMHNTASREQKALTMLAVLGDYFDRPLGELSLLDVGASTGIIDHRLAREFGSVAGIDIDDSAIQQAQENYPAANLHFSVGDAMALTDPDESYDVVICAQVYEHVPDANRMMKEIYRVMKPGGVCYFAASNRLMWNEPHYHLPLLSVVPRFLAHYYVRAFGKAGYYHELHFSYWGLKKLVRQFEIVDYTRRIVTRPTVFHAQNMLPPGSTKAKVARLITTYAYWLVPGYIWLLRKPARPQRPGVEYRQAQ